LRPGGLAEFDADDRWRIRDTRTGLPAHAVHTLMRERYRDALWLGTMGAGALRAEPGRWALLDERSGLPDRLASGIGHIKGRLWVGTAGGAVEWRDGAFVPLLRELGRTLVHDFIDSAEGGRWVATAAGVHRYGIDGRHRHYTVDNSALPAVAAQRLATSAAEGVDAVYIGTSHGLARWTTGRDELQVVGGEADWLLGAAILDLAARGETLAIASNRGAAVVRGSRWWRLPEACLAGDVASAVAIAPGGWIVFALRGGALLRVDSEHCEVMVDVSAIGAPSRLAIDSDSLTVFGARGAERFALAGDRIDGPPLRLGPADGLEQTEVIAATTDSLGRLYAATSAGVHVYDPRPLAHPRSFSTAPLRITAASHGEPGQPLAPGMRLPAGTEAVAFEYRLYSFEREHAHRYRVRLLGLDAAPRPWTDSATIRFERLPPGNYNLVVEARDADGASVEPVAFAFSVGAWWWQQPWVQVLAALALIGSGTLVGRWRIRQATRRAEALEEQVQRRTRDLAEANAKLAALAVTDTLTGLPNRRHYTDIAPALAAHDEVLVGLIDIDHFKRINDTLGHEAGDTVLVAVARALTGALGPGEQALRWGGEEFLVLLPGIDEQGTEPRIRALLEAIATVTLPADPEGRHVTASAGFERYRRAEGDGSAAALERAIARADEALYAAKRGGRDRAVRVGKSDAVVLRGQGR
jgi:diguanylate cyclase (GGDEF)-like protein